MQTGAALRIAEAQSDTTDLLLTCVHHVDKKRHLLIIRGLS